MNSVNILKVWIDADNRLCIKPQTATFEYIYRSAKGVNWNADGCFLYSQPMRTMQPKEWFYHMLSAVENEYGCHLLITASSKWENVDDSVRQLILSESIKD